MKPVFPRELTATAAWLLLLPAAAWSQSTAPLPATVTVHGIAFDSLHGAPLRGAVIAINGIDRNTVSDSTGHFVFDSVPPGKYVMLMEHDVLDSIGVTAASTTLVVTTGRDTVTIAVPSFAALWGAACHTPTPPKDTGLLVGMVRQQGGVSTGPGATISASWLDMTYERTQSIAQRRWRFNVKSDSTGGFIMCGVPTATGVRLFAATDSATTGIIDLLPLDSLRIFRVDLQLGSSVDTSARGLVAGIVTGDAGQPLPNARVVADGVREVRTGADGRFVMREVPLGTQQIEVRAIGLAPTVATVDVVARDTAHVTVQLSKATMLDSMRIIATSVRQQIVAGFEERRKSGWGTYRDSSSIAKYTTLMSVFAEIPSVTINSVRGKGPQILLPSQKPGTQCLADLWIDRIQSDQADLADLRPEDIAAVELYKRAMEVPPEFLAKTQGSGDLSNTRCGAVVVWTKRIWP